MIDIEKKQLSATLCMHKSLRMFEKCILDIKMWSWWVFTHHFPQYMHKVRVLGRMLVEQNCLNSVVGRYDHSSQLCNLCDSREVETVSHMLFTCEYLQDLRHSQWQMVKNSAPPALRLELDNMNDSEKSVFILSGLKCPYTAEWADMYINIINYCYELYIK